MLLEYLKRKTEIKKKTKNVPVFFLYQQIALTSRCMIESSTVQSYKNQRRKYRKHIKYQNTKQTTVRVVTKYLLISIFKKCGEELEKGAQCEAFFMDLSKTFDTQPHKQLLARYRA